ncbi:MAG: hypothetical protein GXY83_17440 [Rhodopirellula sp.]|nr:hypothetical protein [Rhodopirellula sp.]
MNTPIGHITRRRALTTAATAVLASGLTFVAVAAAPSGIPVQYRPREGHFWDDVVVTIRMRHRDGKEAFGLAPAYRVSYPREGGIRVHLDQPYGKGRAADGADGVRDP